MSRSRRHRRAAELRQRLEDFLARVSKNAERIKNDIDEARAELKSWAELVRMTYEELSTLAAELGLRGSKKRNKLLSIINTYYKGKRA